MCSNKKKNNTLTVVLHMSINIIVACVYVYVCVRWILLFLSIFDRVLKLKKLWMTQICRIIC